MSEAGDEVQELKFCRVRKAAESLGVSVRTFYRIVGDGQLRIVHVRGCACVAEGDLKEYMRKILERRMA